MSEEQAQALLARVKALEWSVGLATIHNLAAKLDAVRGCTPDDVKTMGKIIHDMAAAHDRLAALVKEDVPAAKLSPDEDENARSLAMPLSAVVAGY